MCRGWGIKIRKFRAITALAIATTVAALGSSHAVAAPLEICVPGASAGECTNPAGLATDFETGTLYVVDKGNNRIDIFKNGGKEIGTPASFASGITPAWITVDNVAASPSHHDVYVTSGFTIRKYEPDGTLVDELGEEGDGTPENCQLERENDQIAVGPNGDVYVADSFKSGAPTNNYKNRVVKFDAAGNCIGAVSLFEEVNRFIVAFAVDSGGHSYVITENTSGIRKFDAGGSFEYELDKGIEAGALAADAGDNLFAWEQGTRTTKPQLDHFFSEFSPTGAVLRRFGYALGTLEASPSLAALHSLDGDLFAGSSAGVHYYALPPASPVVFPEACHVKNNSAGSVRATLQAEVNLEGKATTFKFEYEPLGGVGSPFEHAQSSTPVEIAIKPGSSQDFEMHEAAEAVEPLEPETAYRCRVVVTNTDGSATGEEGTFITGHRIEFGPAWTSEVDSTSAVVNVEANPEGAEEASGQVEYVTDAQYQVSGFAEALSAPTPPLDFGSAEAMALRSAKLTGLSPDTLYHYRLRAHSSALPPEGAVCPNLEASCPEFEHTFMTFGAEEAKPDNRGYELVSPAQKNSAEVVGPANGRGFSGPNSVLIQAGAPNGESVTYTSWVSFGTAQAAPATSQYLSERNQAAERWETKNISPAGFQASVFVPPYLGFAGDLRFAPVEAGETSLAVNCPAGFENLYLRDASGSLRCLTTEPPQTTNRFGYCFTYGGASEDGSRAFFKDQFPYVNAPAGNGFSLYESHEGQIQVVSVLPGQSEPVAPTSKTTFGAKTGEGCQTGQSILHNAVSADGSKVIWTYVATSGASQLLDRINGSETVQIDESHGGSGTGEGLFWAASKDGGIVYFSSPARLTSNSKAAPNEEDLYRYDFSKPPSSRLSDLTKGVSPGDVQGVLGTAEDGQVVYYVAGSVLTPETETNQVGEHAEVGKDNLYVYNATEGKSHFIAVLSSEDSTDWESQPISITARVSPDGQHLAFLTVRAQRLAGFDNTLAATQGKFEGTRHCQINEIGILGGGEACPEAFVYDKQANSLTCASCNPAGSRPLGPALLPGWTSMSEGPRYLSADGKRLFFETYDRLLPADENNLRDIYEWEASGSGTCTPKNSSFDPVSGGCHFLISGGKSEDISHLIDASSDGRDVFFSTREPLVGWDTNENFDVYDYREGGGFAEPAPPPLICEGEASCKPSATAPPTPPAPTTPTFNGPGNPKPKKPKKKQKANHHKKKKQKANHHKRKNQKKDRGE